MHKAVYKEMKFATSIRSDLEGFLKINNVDFCSKANPMEAGAMKCSDMKKDYDYGFFNKYEHILM